MKERIYKLTLDVKNPDVPFSVLKSIASESGNLVQVFARFQLMLVQLLAQIKEEETNEKIEDALRKLGVAKDDIPF